MLPGLIAGLMKERAAAGEDADGLVVKLLATQACDHLESAATRHVRPRLLGLLARHGRVTATEAAEQLDLHTRGGVEVLVGLGPQLTGEALRAALERLDWRSAWVCPAEAIAAMVRRAVGEGQGDEWVARVRELEEPRRSRILEALGEPIAAEEDPVTRMLAGEVDEEMLAAEWRRIAAIEDRTQRLDAWELRMAQLGSRASLALSRRWLAEVRAADGEALYRLQVGVPAGLWEEAVAGLSPALACEARVWLVWDDHEADAGPALAAVLATELEVKVRTRLLASLVERTPGEVAEAAARALLATPGCAAHDALGAIGRLPRAEQAAHIDAWCLADPFEHWRPVHPTAWVIEVLVRLAEVAGADGRAAILEVVRGLIAGWSEAQQVAALAAFAAWMDAEARAAVTARGLTGEHAPQVVAALVALLPAAEVEAALTGPIARALRIPEADERWATLGGLVGDLSDAQGGAILRSLWARRAGDDPHEILAFPKWAMDTPLRRALVEHELAHPFRPYTAWILGSRARGLPPAERGPVLDRAIEEFRAIAAAPTSPGNDAGPFVEMADLLDEAQTRRALEVVEAMATAGAWGDDLEYSRQHLAMRLGTLGHVEEAVARIRATRDPASMLGSLAGELLALGTGWSAVVRLFEGIAEDDLGAALAGLTWAIAEAMRANRADVAEGVLGLIGRVEGERREEIIKDVVAGFGAALPAARWLAEIEAHVPEARRAAVLLELARVAGAEAGEVVVEAARILEAGAEDIHEVFDELCAVAACLPLATRARLLARWIGGFPRRGSWFMGAWGEAEVGREVAAVLAGLGGDAALVAAARGVVEVARILE